MTRWYLEDEHGQEIGYVSATRREQAMAIAQRWADGASKPCYLYEVGSSRSNEAPVRVEPQR